jgi:hypothetical protein
MKKMLLLLVITISVVACKNETAKTSNDPQFEGEFIFVADGAVLKGDRFIYGVTIDEMSEELKERVAPIKNDDYDMVAVVVKGVLKNKAEGTEGWDEVLTITEIVSVSDTPSEADIKIEAKKEGEGTN